MIFLFAQSNLSPIIYFAFATHIFTKNYNSWVTSIYLQRKRGETARKPLFLLEYNYVLWVNYFFVGYLPRACKNGAWLQISST